MLFKIIKYSLGSIFVFTLVFTFYTSLILFLFKYIDPPTTAFIQQNENNSVSKIILNNNILQSWIPIKSISNNIIYCTIASEDQKFVEHLGLDLIEVEKVISERMDGKMSRGASTITQQVSKNLFLFPQKLFIRKGIEVYYSLLMELVWSKKRIIEVYLNTAQFGENIFGVESASKFYFNKPAQYLSINEAAQLIAILPNPTKLKLKNKSNYLNNRILKIEKEINNINKNEINKILIK
jgi:monofunctional glycosyltransferase